MFQKAYLLNFLLKVAPSQIYHKHACHSYLALLILGSFWQFCQFSNFPNSQIIYGSRLSDCGGVKYSFHFFSFFTYLEKVAKCYCFILLKVYTKHHRPAESRILVQVNCLHWILFCQKEFKLIYALILFSFNQYLCSEAEIKGAEKTWTFIFLQHPL